MPLSFLSRADERIMYVVVPNADYTCTLHEHEDYMFLFRQLYSQSMLLKVIAVVVSWPESGLQVKCQSPTLNCKTIIWYFGKVPKQNNYHTLHVSMFYYLQTHLISEPTKLHVRSIWAGNITIVSVSAFSAIIRCKFEHLFWILWLLHYIMNDHCQKGELKRMVCT